jgi:hypothetical protein
VTIETELLKKNRSGLLTFDLIDTHRSVEIIRIPYEVKLRIKAGQIDFWQTFWFEIERRMKLSTG